MMKVKDSGVSYIGNIPISWYTKKIKYVAVECSESGLMNPKESQYIGLENIVGYSNRIIVTNTEYELSIQKKCYKDNILFGKLRPYLSKVVIAPYDGFCTGEFLELTKYKGDIRFLRYSLLNANLIDTINMSTYGAKMPRANSEFIMNCYIAYPTYNEQKIISDFLDTKCEEIEALSMDIQAEIDTLEEYKRSVITEKVTKGLNTDVEMKDSGIEWVGKCPAHWQFLKGKYIFSLRNDKGNMIELQLLSPTQKFGVIPQSLFEKITTNTTVKVKESTDLSQFKTIHKGDFCISLRSFQGGFEYCTYEGVVSPAYQVFYPVTEICGNYYKYLFKNQSFIKKMNSYTISLRDGKNIAFADFGNTYLPIPPMNEQERISAFLNEKCVEIDSIIETKKEQLKVLDEYKKAIIYEYVTGKKEVSV